VPFFYGWVMVFVGGLSIAASAPGQTNLIAIFVDPMIEGLDVSRSTISTLFAAGTLAASFGMAIIGFMIDRYGPRSIMIFSVLVFGGIVMLMGAVPSEPEIATIIGLFLGFFGLRLLGRGALNMLGTIMVSLWFRKKRGRATSYASGAGWLVGLGVFPPIASWLIGDFGWRETWFVMGVGIWIIMLPPAFFLIRRTPESVGLLPDGEKPVENNGETAAGELIAPVSVDPEDNWTVREAIRTRSLYFILFASMAWATLGAGMVFHHTSLLEARGVSSNAAAWSISAIAVMNFIGNLIAGRLNDRFPNNYTLVVAQSSLMVALLLALVVNNEWQAWVYAGLLGVTQGMVLNTGNVIWANYFGRKNLGSIRGATTWVVGVTSAIGPLPIGLLFDVTGGYTIGLWLYIVLLAPMIISAALAVKPVRPPRPAEADGVLTTDTPD